MEKLRIHRRDLYEIEVNDNGDVITFDMEDVDLPFKLQRAYDGVKKAQETLQKKLVVIGRREDHKGKDDIFSANELAVAKARSEAFTSMRAAIDEFLGEGGCDKVFGSTNYISMFDDLFDALSTPGEDGKSHLDRMQVNAEGIKKRIENKYGEKESGVLK